MQWFTKNKKYVLIALAAVFMVPYFAFQNMKERKARELGEVSSPLDPKVDGVRVAANKNGVFLVYQDDTRYPADGLGVAGITLDDHKQAPERLKAAGVKDDDFPVLAFFNATGFDATGNPVAVRRARDGSLVYSAKPEARVALAVPQREGGFVIYQYQDSKLASNTVKDDDWFRKYMGVEPPKAMTQEELDKLSPAQLKELGIQRLTEKKFDAKEATDGLPEPPKSSGGLKGKVLKVGDVKNPLIPLAVPVLIFDKDKAPTGEAPSSNDSPQPAASTVAGADGSYSVKLPPGTYIVAVVLDGKLYGNALKPGQWPTVKVTDKVKEYDFRVPTR